MTKANPYAPPASASPAHRSPLARAAAGLADLLSWLALMGLVSVGVIALLRAASRQ